MNYNNFSSQEKKIDTQRTYSKSFTIKISSLCHRIISKMNSYTDANLEWSGVLFLEHISEKEFVAKYILPVDIGSSGYTEFKNRTIDMQSIVNEFPMDWVIGDGLLQGFVHSHHSMTTSPSGVDIQEFADSIDSYKDKLYISLIVNHHGKYSCRAGFLTNQTFNFHSEIGSKNLSVKGSQLVIVDEMNVLMPWEWESQEHDEFVNRICEHVKKIAPTTTGYQYNANSRFKNLTDSDNKTPSYGKQQSMFYNYEEDIDTVWDPYLQKYVAKAKDKSNKKDKNKEVLSFEEKKKQLLTFLDQYNRYLVLVMNNDLVQQIKKSLNATKSKISTCVSATDLENHIAVFRTTVLKFIFSDNISEENDDIVDFVEFVIENNEFWEPYFIFDSFVGINNKQRKVINEIVSYIAN